MGVIDNATGRQWFALQTMRGSSWIHLGIADRQVNAKQSPRGGSRQMARYMQRQSHKCGRHRVRRLMRLMRLPVGDVNITCRPAGANHKAQSGVPFGDVNIAFRAVGAWISRTFLCSAGFFIWWRSWTGTAAMALPGRLLHRTDREGFELAVVQLHPSHGLQTSHCRATGGRLLCRSLERGYCQIRQAQS